MFKAGDRIALEATITRVDKDEETVTVQIGYMTPLTIRQDNSAILSVTPEPRKPQGTQGQRRACPRCLVEMNAPMSKEDSGGFRPRSHPQSSRVGIRGNRRCQRFDPRGQGRGHPRLGYSEIFQCCYRKVKGVPPVGRRRRARVLCRGGS